MTAAATETMAFTGVSKAKSPTWRPPRDFAFARHIPQVPLSDSELLLTSHYLPIAINYLADGPRVVAILDAQFHRTPVINASGQWQKGYMPVALRSLPFRLAPGPDGEMQVEIAGKLDADDEPGLPVLRADGSLSPKVANITALLRRLETGKQALRKAAEILLIADVLTPLKMAKLADAAANDGRYLIVDRNKFAALSNSRVAHLMKGGFLAVDLATACIFSQRLIPTLVAVAAPPGKRADRPAQSGLDELAPALSFNVQIDHGELFSFERFDEMCR